MNLFTGVIVFFMAWWICLFLVLPWGIKQDEDVQTGNQYGAPDNPYLLRKFIITTCLAFFVLLCVYLVDRFNLFAIRDL